MTCDDPTWIYVWAICIAGAGAIALLIKWLFDEDDDDDFDPYWDYEDWKW